MRAALGRHRRTLGWAALCALAFCVVAALTTLPLVSAWDAQCVLAVNAVVATNPPLRVGAATVTALGSPVSVDLLTAVAVVAVCRRPDARVRRMQAAAYLVGARLGELGLETGVKALVDRPRPMVPLPVATAADASFPSGHAAGTAVFCTALLLLVHARSQRPPRPSLVVIAALATVCVATSRVLLGVHYPTDVVAGILLGVATALALTPILAPRRRDEGVR
ncbi:MAG: phosphatase PAP2 family protein [Pseudonocardia sp.]|nr:phosphatase PAP2 family protein [Pseudonocardia sp.]